MRQGHSGIGSRKHGKSGKPSTAQHFTGKRRGKPIRRKGLTRKQRAMKRGGHRNKYSQLTRAAHHIRA